MGQRTWTSLLGQQDASALCPAPGGSQDTSRSCHPHGAWSHLCCHPIPSHPSTHSQSTKLAASRGSCGPHHQHPAPASSHKGQNTFHHLNQGSNPAKPDLATTRPPLPAWGKVGMEGKWGRRKREQTLSPQTSKSSAAGAFGTV